MPMQKPLFPLLPAQVRKVPRSFAWIDHALRSSDLMQQLEPGDFGLYLFLVLAADSKGLSCWRLDRMERFMPCFTRDQLWDARDHLQQLGLISFKSWYQGEPDGIYQVMPLPGTRARKAPRMPVQSQ